MICRANRENISILGENSVEERAVVGTLEYFCPSVKRRTGWRWCLTSGSALAAEVRPLFAFTSIGKDAYAALTPVVRGADLGTVSLLHAIGGGGVGDANLLGRRRRGGRGAGDQQG